MLLSNCHCHTVTATLILRKSNLHTVTHIQSRYCCRNRQDICTLLLLPLSRTKQKSANRVHTGDQKYGWTYIVQFEQNLTIIDLSYCLKKARERIYLTSLQFLNEFKYQMLFFKLSFPDKHCNLR